MTHDLVITRAHFQCGGLIAATEIKFTTEDGGELIWKGMVRPQDHPVEISVPGEGMLSIEHCQMSSVSISHKEYVMRTHTTHFEKIGRTEKKVGKCPACGKRAQRSKEFYQTLSPFNKNPDGSVKSAGDIRKALEPEIQKWAEKPVYHVKCEG